VKGNGIPLATFFQAFMNPDLGLNWPSNYLEFIDDFKKNCISELYSDLDSLGKSVEEIYRVNNDVGEPVRLNPYYFSRLMYSERGWLNGVLMRLLIAMVPASKEIKVKEAERILSISESLIIDLRKLSERGSIVESSFDLNAWRNDKFHKPIGAFEIGSTKFSLEMSKFQYQKLSGFAKANAHLDDNDFYFVAAESIFPRADLFYGLKEITETAVATLTG
jgi:hypothetical protein